MADNAELIALLWKMVDEIDEGGPNYSKSNIFRNAANALAEADAKIAELTEIVEGVHNIQSLKTFVNSKVKKLKAMNRRLK